MKKYNCKNTSGETMPAYGIGKLTAVGPRTGMTNAYQFEIGKPDGEPGIFVVNGPVPLADDGVRSMIPWDAAGAVLVASGETVNLNSVIGPVADEWACSTAGIGYICQADKETNNIVPVHYVSAGSGGGGGGCGCGCLCADGYDVVLPDGTKTTKFMRWSTTADIEIDVPNGHIWLPKDNPANPLDPSYPLQYVPASDGIWTLDVSSMLKARETDTIDGGTGEVTRGDEVTTGVTKSGTLTFRRYDQTDNEFMSLTIEITGTIPPP